MLVVPAALHAIATDLQQRLQPHQTHLPLGEHVLSINGEDLRFPARLYVPPSVLFKVASQLTGDARSLCLCLAMRHYDGHVRQRAVEQLGPVDMAWAQAFHLALLGEYVDEVSQAVAVQARHTGLATYAQLARENPGFFRLAHQRAISYWNAYYRHRYPRHRQFPAVALLGDMIDYR
ncbi:hypothetical protein [Stenotrophomonas sp. 24(2023)]|uniref:hypothetical protein n=1 Tax=Stenotrophomonas sp. 24(2023) TaxID=3068324 RepID=UPI0027DF689E|nr:hypothetical protein [Stenotrophomonas sp. 24(2023)]WMJ69585.1 hypothetical protein Q9R17_00275 [Stenotrophomonas sp. 24(2023)]